jgi:aarF domain-containing kinase
MRPAVPFGRLLTRTEASLCFGPAPRIPRILFRPSQTTIRTFSFGTGSRSRPRPWGYRVTPRTLMAASGGGLAAAAFIELSENGDANPGETGESRMLEVSREEIRKTAGENDGTLRWLRRRVLVLLDLSVWEPICTGFRFLQLVSIFVPVILTVPAIWIGNRIPERDNERSGTLWWYGFLVQAMEWAGPAFIKVMRCHDKLGSMLCELTMTFLSLANGPPQGPTSSLMSSVRSCRSCMPTLPPTPCMPQSA